MWEGGTEGENKAGHKLPEGDSVGMVGVGRWWLERSEKRNKRRTCADVDDPLGRR